MHMSGCLEQIGVMHTYRGGIVDQFITGHHKRYTSLRLAGGFKKYLTETIATYGDAPAQKILDNHVGEEAIPALPEEISQPERIPEGASRKIFVNAYERSPKARRACIKYWGAKCCVCKCDFAKIYGEIGEGFIVVHHLKPLAEVGEQYEVDPIKDLCPVCPNCHAMIHRSREQTLKLDELRERIERVGVLPKLTALYGEVHQPTGMGL